MKNIKLGFFSTENLKLEDLPCGCECSGCKDKINFKTLSTVVFTTVSKLDVIKQYIVPVGFETDLASIPKCFWWYVSPMDSELMKPAILHDYLYRHPERINWGKIDGKNNKKNRKRADKLFDMAMRSQGVSWFKRTVIYRAVRMFGSKSWKGRETWR